MSLEGRQFETPGNMIKHVEKVFQGEYAMPPDVVEKARAAIAFKP